MRFSSTKGHIKTLALFVMVALLSATRLNAQTDIIIGTGTAGNTTTTYPCPLQDWYEGSRAQYLYLASELLAAGMAPGNIVAIKYNVESVGSAGLVEDMEIKVGGTNVTTLSSSSWDAFTTPPSTTGSMDYQPVAGANMFNLTIPFIWNGTDNILIEFCNGEPGNATGTWYTNNPVVPWTTGLAFNGSHTYRTDNDGNLCGTTSTANTGDQTTRPNIVFSWIPGTPCSGTPDGGTAVSSASSVCFGESFNLSLTGATIASGITYQWQSSPDNTTWTSMTGATTPFYNTTQTATSYYRAIVTCSNGGAADTSAVVQVLSPVLVSGTFTINSAQPTGGSNFQSFNDAYNYIKCGISGPVVFNVVAGSGPYTEQLIITPVPGASATNTITFNGNGATLQYLSTNSSERAVIKLNDADHFTFDSLHIVAQGTSTSEYGFGIHLMNNADSNTIQNCTIDITTASTSTNYAGIAVSASNTSATTSGTVLCDYNTFSGNTITGGYYGFTLVGSSTEANGNNKIVNNTISEFYLYGLYILGSFNTLVEGNTFSRPARTSVSTFYGLYATSLSTRLTFTRNKIFDPFGGDPTSTSTFYGIYFTGVDALGGFENVISNNLVYNTTGDGSQYGIYNTSSDNIFYYHNTISLDGPGTGSSASSVTRGFYQTTTAAGIEFKNNIITITRGGPGEKTAIHFNTTGSTIISDKNNLYLNSGSGTENVGSFGTAAQATLINWQTASGQDAASISSNPIYTDMLAGNYKPTNASINNLGVPLSIVTIDINGDPRNAATPDMGAYEFEPAPCTAPPVPGTANVSQTPVCAGSPVMLTVTGNSVGLSQTYQWQSATDIAGPYTDIGNVLTNPDTTINATSTLYYRVAVTCSGNTQYSVPVLLAINQPLAPGTYTIDQTAAPGATNFTSFNAAKAAMMCGIAGPIVFNVVPGTGTYNEQLVLDSIPGTSAINTITFNGNGNTIAFASDNSNERAVIKLNGADHVTFDSLVIDATGGTYGFGFQFINNADSNTLKNCTINTSTSSTSSSYAGIVMSASATSATGTGDTWCDGNSIHNNTVNGGYYGITLVGSSSEPIYNNTVTSNTVQDIYFYGIYLYGNINALVEANDVSRPTRTTTSTFYGIYVSTRGESLRISKNKIHNPFDGNLTTTSGFYGIYFTGVDAPDNAVNIVSNNLIYNVNGEGDEYGLYNSSSDNVKYYHNTLSFDNTASTHSTSWWTRAIYQVTTATGLEYKDNLVTITRGGDGDRHAIFMSASGTDYVANNNNYYVTGNDGVTFIGYNGADHATLAAWQAASAQDVNSLTLDPLYTSPAAADFEPRHPALDNKGVYVNIDTDIEGTARNATTPDIGAWEFTIPPCTTPPTAGTTVAYPNSGICMETPIVLGLSGNSSGSGQTYQWQYSSAATGPWTDLGAPMMFPDTTILAGGTYYYRAAVTCSGNTAYADPVLVTMNPPFQAGTYTINNTIPTGGINFNSFVEAVAALECGIDGPVIFNVADGTYTEQVRMHHVRGTSEINTVTFQGANSDPALVILTHDITGSGSNYVLQLDSASRIIYKNITITATGSTNARAVELAHTASYDSLVNLVINVPTSTSTSNAKTGIFADDLIGGNHVIKGNKIYNGSSGIYIAGNSVTRPADNIVIDSNFINGSYYYGIYLNTTSKVQVSKNTVNVNAPRNSTSYGIYSSSSDSAFRYVGNKVNISGTTTTVYGMYFTGCEASVTDRGIIAANTIMADSSNTGAMYGLYQTSSDNNNTVNNVISIYTTGSSSYGMYGTGLDNVKFYNNSVQSMASSSSNNIAAYFSQTSFGNGNSEMRNNVFSHLGGGRAMYIVNPGFINSDYNMFYTTGSVLIQHGTANQYATLQEWRDAAYWDLNSIVYQPAFVSTNDLHPDVANPEVWAMHGRGVQLPDHNYDFNNDPRPVTLTEGVPDLGAYEFVPTSIPPVLPATPVTPAPGTTQVFMFGTDTVQKITWAPSATVPDFVSVRRYSGVVPPALATGAEYMYFYTDVDITGNAPSGFNMQQFYIDSWRGFIPNESEIGLGRTDATAAWVVSGSSQVNTIDNVIAEPDLDFLDKFTGLRNTAAPPSQPPVITVDSSNSGTRFWVGYGHHYGFGSNSQDMILYLSAGDSANVTVRVNGTSWVRHYAIPANTAIVSDVIPKYGLVDARLLDEGLSERGISITSDVPIVAYAHIYDGANSGAGMLLPTGVYGYEYISLNSSQYYPTGGAGSYSWFYVIADRDSTLVEITPSVTTKGGRPAGVPFTVYLNRGEVYNVMGTINGAVGTDLTGSKIRSIPNAGGKCYPIAVFSGSSRTAICYTTNGDNFIQQVFPSQAWGKKYLTFATANSNSNTLYNSNVFRVMVKDPSTVVTLNGATLDPATLITPGNYYQFSTTQGDGPNGAIAIEADKPVLVAQYMVSTSANQCPGVTATGDGDPELIYISPVEQGIKKAVFYNTDENAIDENYINVVIPTAGLPTLTIDGNSAFTHVFAHPYLAGYSCVRHNLGGAAGQHIIQSDSAFTAITYGLGSVESYGYNAGTLVKNLNAIGGISNVYSTDASSQYTCEGTPFRFSMQFNVKPTSIVWQFSRMNNLTPNTDVTQTDPVPVDSTFVNGQWVYTYTVNQDYFFTGTGTFVVPIVISHPSFEGCNNEMELTLLVNVIPAPVTDFTINYSGCINDIAQFTASGATTNGTPVSQWSWNFGDSTTSALQDPTKQWTAPGTYDVLLQGIADDGCIGDTIIPVVVNQQSVPLITPDSLAQCAGDVVTFSVQDSTTGGVYNWYTDSTGGTLVHTGSAYTFTVTAPVSFYIESVVNGCVSDSRKKVTVVILPDLAAPVAVTDSASTDFIRFKWNAVTGATGYEVSTDGGASWSMPSSGATGLTHTVAGLQPLQSVTLLVRALGGCEEARSAPVTAQTLIDQIFIPNSFTPNGDGRNDVWLVYGYVIRNVHVMVFNQWGEKIFESRDQSRGWDGTQSGKRQPSGVYIYVCNMTLNDGTRIQRKGAINLVR